MKEDGERCGRWGGGERGWANVDYTHLEEFALVAEWPSGHYSWRARCHEMGRISMWQTLLQSSGLIAFGWTRGCDVVYFRSP